jgi:hypothetical protein
MLFSLIVACATVAHPPVKNHPADPHVDRHSSQDDPWNVGSTDAGRYIGASTILGKDAVPFTIVTDDGSLAMVHGETPIRMIPDVTTAEGDFRLISGSDGPLIGYRTPAGLQLLRCANAACASSDTKTIQFSVPEHWAIVSRQNDIDVFGLERSAVTGKRTLVHLRCEASNCGDPARTVLSEDLGDGFMTADATQTATWLAYVDRDAKLTLFYACGRLGCTLAAKMPFTPGSVVADVSIDATTTSGLSFVAVEEPGGVVRRTVCDLPGCSMFRDAVVATGASARVIAGTGDDGLPFVVFASNQSRHLQFLHCAERDCKRTQVTDLGDRSVFSVTQMRDGLPLLTLRDSQPHHVSLLRCKDVACRTYAVDDVDVVPVVP